MKFKIYVSIFLITVFSGCSSNNIKNNELYKPKYKAFKAYIPNDNTNIVVGYKENAIALLTYYHTVNNIIEKRVMFYIDKIPYKREFYTCNQKTVSSKTLKIAQELDFKNIKFYDKNFHCKSEIYVTKDYYNKILGKFKFNFLNGFNVQNVEEETYLYESYIVDEDNRTGFDTYEESFVFYPKKKVHRAFWEYKELKN